MIPTTNGVPFRLRTQEEGSVEHGRAMATKYKLAGRARLTHEGSILQLEWAGTREVSEAGRGVARQVIEPVPSSIVELPVRDIALIEVTGGWWLPRIELAMNELSSLAAMPSATAGQVRLGIARRDRSLAAELVMNVQLELADRALQAAESLVQLPRATRQGN